MQSKFFLYLLFFCLFSLSGIEAKERDYALSYLNTIRMNSGLIPLSTNKLLTRSASSHAKYLVKNQNNGHYEKKGKKGFTGRTPTHRVLHAGYKSKMVMENVSVNAKDSHDAINNLMSAIYHRFVFLSMDKDEIGEGRFQRKKASKIKTAHVYNLGSSSLIKLCKEYFIINPGVMYRKNLCKESSKLLPQWIVLEVIDKLKYKNAKIILYPYPQQTNISPVFYTEHPHPLPGSKVSGYPISVQFNEAYIKKVILKSFRLFDSKGNEIKKRKIITYKNDKNHIFTKYQFAFMPLKRLEYSTTYRAEFVAFIDGKRFKKNWNFTTKKPQGILYKITKKKTIIPIKNAEKIVLYFEPKSRTDLLKGIRYTGKLHIVYLDKNTLEITLAKRNLKKEYRIEVNGKRVILRR